MERKPGLYKLDGTFESQEQIKRRLALEGQTTPHFETDIKFPKDVYHYLHKADERATIMKEQSARAENYVHVQLPRTSTINVMGDLHFGNPNTDYKRIQQELEVILNTPDSYILFVGDLVEGIHWGGASTMEQSQTLDEQRGFLRSVQEATKGRVIAGISGEHDSKWAAKTGSDPYFDFSERTGAPYVRGVAEIELDVGEQTYFVVAQHKGRGHSMYSKVHPTTRQSRFDLQGADVYISAHNHRKAVAQEALREFGKSRNVTHVAIGPYKTGDEYGQRQGFVSQNPEEMYGAAVTLHDDRKEVEVHYDILKANKD